MIQHNLKAVWFYLPPDLIYVSPTDPISVLAFLHFQNLKNVRLVNHKHIISHLHSASFKLKLSLFAYP